MIRTNIAINMTMIDQIWLELIGYVVIISSIK